MPWSTQDRSIVQAMLYNGVIPQTSEVFYGFFIIG